QIKLPKPPSGEKASTERAGGGNGPDHATGRAAARLLNLILTEIAHSRAKPGSLPAMFFIIGSVVVIASVVGGYMANGGHMAVLWQPFELVIILGAAIGGFVTANRK